MKVELTEEFILQWNYQFPADRWYRQKYNIPLFSPQHLDTNPLDIAMEYLEEKTIEKYLKKHEENKKREKEYRDQNTWILLPSDTEEEIEDDLFDKIDIAGFNKKDNATG